MNLRSVVLAGCFVLICALGFLTVSVLVREGIDVLVIVSLLVLALLGFGVLGALTTPPSEDE
jgi:hypothetical protein